MTKDDFIKLYEKYLAGNSTPAEKKQLEAYRDEFTVKEYPWNEQFMGDKEETGKVIYDGITAGMTTGGRRGSVRRMARIGLRAAAVLLPLIVAGIYIWSAHRQPRLMQTVGVAQPLANNVLPGGNKALLTLADGHTMMLDSDGEGYLTQQGNSKVIRTCKGELSYEDAGPSAGLAYNTISTPRGGQYAVVLPDGSKVWLNAASSLHFPVSFTGRERKVEMTGEGYFDIAKDATRPFVVAVTTSGNLQGGRSLEVAVLGTRFDIMAYGDEPAITTTLLEGSVRLKKEDHSWLLKPGQQGLLKDTGTIELEQAADTTAVTAWKNGSFEFYGNIKGIMRQIARWYDVEVEFNGDFSGMDFRGAISRTATLSNVLHLFESTNTIHFVIEGKKIRVLPVKKLHPD